MKLSEKNHENIFYYFLLAISTTLIFRQLSTLLIICFVIFNLFFYKKLKFENKILPFLLIISSPLLLDIIFFWNNDDLISGFKSTEKRLSLLIFPIFILTFTAKINFINFLKSYVIISVSILLVLLSRYILLYPDFVHKYLNGIHLWEMGYKFSSSFGIHAPALNMHVSFISVSAFFLLFIKYGYRLKLLYFTCFIFSLFFLLIINTRVAIVTGIFGYIVVIIFQFIHKNIEVKKLVKISVAVCLFIILSITLFAKAFPYITHKFSKGSFSDLEMVGRLDEFENPEKQVYNKLVTRLTIWQSAYQLSKEKLLIGYGASDGKKELVNYYEKTNQFFLSRNKFPVHNQYLDFLLKFGVLGFCVVLLYILSIGWLGLKLGNAAVFSFFMIFFICNLTDDFLIRYDGITFSALWFSIFANQYKFKSDLI